MTVAVWTGLRRSELRQLEWRDVLLDEPMPHLKLRAATTKPGRADTILLHPQLAENFVPIAPPTLAPWTACCQRCRPSR